MAKNANAGKIIVKVKEMEDGRIAELYEVNMPMSVKYFKFQELIKWCKGNQDVPAYTIKYEQSKNFIGLIEWLDIQRELKFINEDGKILK